MSEDQQASDREQFERIVRQYEGGLLRYAGMTLGEADAQDVVQEVFMKLHRLMTRGGLREAGALGPWLFRVAHSCTNDVFRKRKANQKLVQAAAVGAAESVDAEDCSRREDCDLAMRMLGRLPPEERRVVLLKVEQGMTYRQISEVTSQSLGTVGMLMNQGLDRLARMMKAAGAF